MMDGARTEWSGDDSGREHSSALRFPLVVKSIGERSLARQVSKLSRPWGARVGEVYAVERRAEVEEGGTVTFLATEMGYWRKREPGQTDLTVSVFDLPPEELKRVAPLVVLGLEDNRHVELIAQHIKYHHETRGEIEGWQCRSYVCLSFWGGMLVLEESAFEGFRPGNHLLPLLSGGIGFGFIWKEIPRSSVPDAFNDADVLLGQYVTDRLYPSVPGPAPVGRAFGLSVQIDDQLLF